MRRACFFPVVAWMLGTNSLQPAVAQQALNPADQLALARAIIRTADNTVEQVGPSWDQRSPSERLQSIHAGMALQKEAMRLPGEVLGEWRACVQLAMAHVVYVDALNGWMLGIRDHHQYNSAMVAGYRMGLARRECRTALDQHAQKVERKP